MSSDVSPSYVVYCLYDAPMYIEAVPNRNSPPAILLRESYRDNGKVKKRTLLNLSDWPPELVEGFKALLKGGAVVPKGQPVFTIKWSLPHGHIAAILGTLRKIVSTVFSAPPATVTAIW